jgi:hypothetical protein
MQAWVEQELRTADLGDARLNERYKLLLDRMSSKPSLKFPALCKGRAEVEAAYRFLDNEHVEEQGVLAPHRAATLGRIRAYPVVIVAQDTSEFDVTRKHERMAGAGPLNDAGRLGLYGHALLAVTPERLPLGIVGVQLWARDADDFQRPAAQKAAERKEKPIDEKESFRWLEGYRAACAVAQEAPGTTVVCVSDSEGDVYECFAAGSTAEGQRRAEWIVRACQDRQLTAPDRRRTPDDKLWEQAAAGPVLQTLTVRVSAREPKSKDRRKRKQPRSARQAVVTVQAARVTLRAPRRCGQERLPDVAVNAVLVREVDPPPGEEPIEWLLLTSLPIAAVEQVLQVVQYYCCRWQIEVYFRVLKSGCKVEESQLETAARFRAYLALCMIVAWRVMYVMMLGRECPELPCDVVLEAEEWQAVYAVVKEEAPPATPPTLGEMVVLIATLGGYLGRKGDGPPGPKAVWVGMQRMTDLGLAWRAFAAHGRSETG